MANNKVLIVDDEVRLRKLLVDFFKKADFTCVEAENGKQAVDIFFDSNDINLVILDVMMPIMNGWEALKAIREQSKVPVIMLTAKSSEDDALHGFEYGADEYITKPFSPRVLVARAQAMLVREGVIHNDIITVKGIKINRPAHTVSIDDKEIDLSYKEFELLEYFIENEGLALSREKILNNVWNYDYFGDARTIDTHVKKLRAKLGKYEDYIKTIWGIGYKFSTES